MRGYTYDSMHAKIEKILRRDDCAVDLVRFVSVFKFRQALYLIRGQSLRVGNEWKDESAVFTGLDGVVSAYYDLMFGAVGTSAEID